MPKDKDFTTLRTWSIIWTMAEQERVNIRTRQTEGIQALRDKNDGKAIGRPQADYPSDWNEVYGGWKQGNITGVEAMEQLGLKKTTFYKLVKEYESEK